MASSETSASRRLCFSGFTLDRDDERLRGPSGPVKLGNKAYRLLIELVEQDGRLLTKDAIFASVWDGTVVSESALTSAVKELRRALGDESRTPRYIESVYGRGYRFIAPVRPADGDSPGPAPAAGPPVAPAGEAARDSAARPPIVVVSPFNDSAVRARYPHCGPGLREEILSGLARFREIQLIADDRAADEAGLGRVLERGYRLSATLLPEGGGVKIIARANRLSDGLVLWAESLSLADAAAGVEAIVRRIIGAALPAVHEDLLQSLPQATGAFYDRYLVAKRRSLTATTFAEARAAAEELEALLRERPDFGLAYPPLVRLYNTDFGYTGLGSSGAPERDRALALARAGLSADRANVHAYTVLGFCHLYHGEHAPARGCLDQALALNPYNAARLNEVAAGMVYLGKFALARSLLDMSLNLQPFPDDSFNEDSGRLWFLEGDCERAREALDSVVRGSIWSELYLAICEMRLETAQGSVRFRAWRSRVERGWHSGSAPAGAEISRWVRYHHPFRGEAGAPLFTAVDAALALAPAARG